MRKLLLHTFFNGHLDTFQKKEKSLYFPATRVEAFAGVYWSVIMGFTNINNPVLLYELDKTLPTPGIYNVLGVTIGGNIFYILL